MLRWLNIFILLFAGISLELKKTSPTSSFNFIIDEPRRKIAVTYLKIGQSAGNQMIN